MPDGHRHLHWETGPLEHCRRNMAGMTQDMALVEFVIVHLRNGRHFLQVYIPTCQMLHIKK